MIKQKKNTAFYEPEWRKKKTEESQASITIRPLKLISSLTVNLFIKYGNI